jgi:uncharacterized protein YcnI
MFRELVLGAVGVVAAVCAASAHVTLETKEATVGAPYKAVLRVPHGCEGAATIALRVRVPDGMIAVKPMPKPGWKIETVSGKYPQAYSHFRNAKLTEGVTEISFTGGNLPDAFYDEFVFTGFLAGDLEAGKLLYFPVVQECEKGVHRWIEIPAAGKPASEYPEPAPALKLPAENVVGGHDKARQGRCRLLHRVVDRAGARRRGVRSRLAGEGVAGGWSGGAGRAGRC